MFKGLLFLTVGSAVDAGHNRDVYAYRGAAKFLAWAGDRQGITVIAFFIGALSIAAIPPFSGFASKHGIVHSLESIHWQYRLLSLVGVGTMASMIKLSRIFFGSPQALPEETGHEGHAYGVQGPYRIGFFIKTAMVLWALPCALLGIFSLPLGRFVQELLGAEHNPVPENLFSLASLGHTLLYAAAAAGLYFLLSSRGGKALTHRIRDFPAGFYGLMAGFAAALFIIAAGMKF
jgi:formate hydrogenlyase subunit 3/multisubunit Na+/H+ antiporter MnhD subunit